MQPDLLIALTAARALDTTFHVPGTSRPQWTAAEAAQACQGMPDHVFAAMLYSYAGATEMYFRLQSSLIAFGTTTARDLEVGQRVKRDGKKRPYIADLCGLFLIEERQPWRFVRKSNEPNLRRVLMGIDEQTWRRKVSPVYEAMLDEYIVWLSIGVGQMRNPAKAPASIGASNRTTQQIAPVSQPAPAVATDDSYNDTVVTLAPAGVVECRVAGSGQFAVGLVKQFGHEHRYTYEQLQGLRDWADIVLKREMAA